MQSIRDAANAVMQIGRSKGKSMREQIARGEADYAFEAERFKGVASADTIRKWRRTHEAMKAGRPVPLRELALLESR